MKNNVKFIRRSAEFNMTQDELAQKIGVSRYTIVGIENGSNTSLETALKLAKLFNKDVTEIFFEDSVASNLQNHCTA